MHRNALRGALVVCLLMFASAAHALFVRPVLETVPVARLSVNLKQMIANKPKDVKLRLNLARLHAMAYAQKTAQVQIRKGKEQLGPWFGYTPKHVPFKVKKSKDAEVIARAKMHLKKALTYYKEVIKMKPKNLTAKLGHAWLIDQSGDTKQAIKEYRDIIEASWAKDQKRKTAPLGGHLITIEAAGYLISLLDKKDDAQEITELKSRIAKLKRLPRPITPIAIPLQDNLTAAAIVNPKANVRFDIDGTGFRDPSTWIHANAAWLVHDPKRSGKITSAIQMFGNVSFWLFWNNGYDALAALDDNGDGYLAKSELKDLALWHDRNSNGKSEPGEVKSLSDWGVVKLQCRYESGNTAECAAFAAQGVWFRDGTVRPTFDVILNRAKSK